MKFVKIVKYILTIIIFTTLQVTLCRGLSISGIIPNIIIPLVITTAITGGTITGAVLGWFCGVFIDALSSGITVIHSITYLYLAVISGNIITTYMRKNLGSVLLFTFLGTVLLEETIHLLHFAIWGVSGLFSALINPILPTALYSVVLGIPVYIFATKFLCAIDRRDYI